MPPVESGQHYEHPAALPDDLLMKECDWGRGRGSGPGGQNRNKVETAVTITHKPTGIHAQAGERRSQKENKSKAIKRLRLALATQHRIGVPIGEIGSALWRSRRQGERIVCNPDHRDYPSLLAEALDTLADAGWKQSKAAIRLEVSRSQLLTLVRHHPPALHLMNEERRKRKLRPLR